MSISIPEKNLDTCISIQTDDFNLNDEYQTLLSDCPAIGAVVTFVGLVRDFNEGDDVTGLFLEHYAGMTEKVLHSICTEAHERWSLQRIRIIHRIGELHPADQIVLVGVSSAHRGDAFAACEFVMDFLKTRAPFWKKEQTPTGGRWIDARASDESAAARWQQTDTEPSRSEASSAEVLSSEKSIPDANERRET